MISITQFNFAVLISFIILSSSVDCKPAKTRNETEENVPAKDLKYTFADGEEIPEGFRFTEADQRRLTEIQFQPCRDGSGGICIPVGQCTPDLKAPKKSANACNGGEECCFGGPPAASPCKNRGGECVEAARCGRSPAQLKSGTECNHSSGETCCIWLY